MRKCLLFACLVFCVVSAFAQSVQLDIRNTKVAKFISIEKSLGSKQFEDGAAHLTMKEIAPPVMFKRKQLNLPDLIISCYYYRKDSAIASLLYEWDDKTVSEKNPTKNANEIKSFIDKYKELQGQVSRAFGSGKSEGDISDLSKIKTGQFGKTDSWKPNDSTHIELHLNLSGRYEKKGPVTIYPTYRIRLDIQFPRKKDLGTSGPDESKINEMDQVLRNFLLHLQDKNFLKARSCLSDQIRKDVTNEQLKMLMQEIRLNEKLVIYTKGVQVAADGSSYMMLQYKYMADGNPPKELLNVNFDEKNKIIGIRPMKRP